MDMMGMRNSANRRGTLWGVEIVEVSAMFTITSKPPIAGLISRRALYVRQLGLGKLG